jgi:hypothetical protein
VPLLDWPLLVVKLITVPVLVLAVSLASRKWGSSVGGLIIGLPLTSGPVLVFLALEQGTAFSASAALGTLLGVIPLCLFCGVYSWTSFRSTWPVSLAASSFSYFALAAALAVAPVPLLAASGAVLLAVFLSLALMPRGGDQASSRELPSWEIPARMLAATTLVVAITEGAATMGARASGLVAPFPVYATIFAVFMHRFDGAETCAPFLRGVVKAALAASAFFFTFAFAVEPWGLATTAVAALTATLAAYGLILLAGGRRLRVSHRSERPESTGS